jgi:hypothetical protein
MARAFVTLGFVFQPPPNPRAWPPAGGPLRPTPAQTSRGSKSMAAFAAQVGHSHARDRERTTSTMLEVKRPRSVERRSSPRAAQIEASVPGDRRLPAHNDVDDTASAPHMPAIRAARRGRRLAHRIGDLGRSAIVRRISRSVPAARRLASFGSCTVAVDRCAPRSLVDPHVGADTARQIVLIPRCSVLAPADYAEFASASQAPVAQSTIAIIESRDAP